ncbi:MAG TPA: response regulator transcription factor [Azospirillum sp.]|nr:response regulator transcription factor [Azospirillum sp.]
MSVVVFNIGGRDVADDRVVSVIRDLKESAGGRNLVVISEVEEAGSILKSLALGVHGYVTTRTPLSVAVQAIRLVAAGGTFIPTAPLAELTHWPAVGGDLPAPALATPHTDAETVGHLTPRQHAVLKCLREGKSNKIIAYELGMCESTVKVHVRNVLRKLGASNRTQAAYLAYEQERLIIG